MELHQLRYFCAIVKAGSFTRAAEQQGVSQPTLSQQIRKLEKSIGAQLFGRQGRALRLTQAGTVFYPAAQEILSSTKRAAAQVRQLETDIRGPLRVGVIPTILPYLIAPHLPAFQREFPEVEITLTEDLTERLVDDLLTGELDLIIVSLPLHSDGIVCSALLRDPLVLVTPPGHRLAAPSEVRGFDLSAERLLLLKEGHCFRDDMLTACKRSRTETSPVFESNHFGTIFPLVASGAGITIAPAMAAAFAVGCSVQPLPRPQFRQIGYGRLRSSGSFKPLAAFTRWLRTMAREIPKPV
ncbi:LysR family transcriptional regulator, hydrogen peroxide-inducible genes activator [Bryocella elongata]|uniref:LysR family transcriptional regulator, hydrogen peroxide-inducible genes activator n=1 Tax=Bryocella elongata TaxID=863522 RepID=A0A1H5U852_9BACT|nr:LysR family transcriptional regulator [Bryocella elongata]SEF71285.1 LysR family transcriptional regulator, hydrogen peroxide-inducible genes activator [Bryocella elongata]